MDQSPRQAARRNPRAKTPRPLRRRLRYARTRRSADLPPAILIATTTWWPLSARLAQAFAHAGASVSLLSPSGNPARTLRLPLRHLVYRAQDPLTVLRAAIAATAPDLIVACDDRVVGHLHRLHAEEQAGPGPRSQLAALIERSIGDPSGYPTVRNRGSLLALAASLGIRTPETRTVHTPADLADWRVHHAFPWVLKADNTWAGAGVRVVHTWPQALAAHAALQRPLGPAAIIRHLSEHNLFPLFERRHSAARSAPRITVQTWIAGRPANSMYACRQGSVLGELAVEVLAAQHALGAATVVRTLDSPTIARAGTLLARHLGLSGFCGLDFMIEHTTGHPFLIELNPRATQLGHLRPNYQPDLAAALLRDLANAAPTPSPAEPYAPEIFAFFPQAWLSNAGDPQLASPNVRHDVPWDQPALVRELLKPSWNQRHRSAKLFQLARRVLSRRRPPAAFEDLASQGE